MHHGLSLGCRSPALIITLARESAKPGAETVTSKPPGKILNGERVVVLRRHGLRCRARCITDGQARIS